MIVRINQIDAARAELTAGWGNGVLDGAIRYTWPTHAFVYQMHILDRDEHGEQVDPAHLQTQWRRLIPHVISALNGGPERAIVRVDGPLADGELLASMGYLNFCERFAVSPLQRFGPDDEPIIASVRMLPGDEQLAKLCADPQLGLERSVRLRVISVPEQIVNPLLDTCETYDERWRDILPTAAFVLSTTVGLKSLLIWTCRFDPAAAKNRIMQKLMELQT
jgi:hypothetical protein